jgi:hypothetical protein
MRSPFSFVERAKYGDQSRALANTHTTCLYSNSSSLLSLRT